MQFLGITCFEFQAHVPSVGSSYADLEYCKDCSA